jgi:hypothetical protein
LRNRVLLQLLKVIRLVQEMLRKFRGEIVDVRRIEK